MDNPKPAFDVEQVDRASLKDIRSVCVDRTLPRGERMRSYVQQIGNPYCYLDGEVVVSIRFADTQISLQDRLRAYACNLE